MTDDEMKERLSMQTKSELVGKLIFAYRTIQNLEAKLEDAKNTEQERIDYFSSGFCSGYNAKGVEEDWITEAFCEYEKKRKAKLEGAKNTEQANQPDSGK